MTVRVLPDPPPAILPTSTRPPHAFPGRAGHVEQMRSPNGIWSEVATARYFGVYPAMVTDIVDKKNLGRIEVKFPWLGADGATVRSWATLCTPYADDDQGLEVRPGKDPEGLAGFEAGRLRRPSIIGSTW